MADPLHDRLTAAVRLRLAIARAASPGPWRSCRMGDSWGVEQDGPRDAHLIFEIGDCGDTQHAGWPRGDAAHIALNDPAWVIRECERDLGVLERHVADRDGCVGCGFDNRGEDRWPWPCDEIRGLADVYEPGWEQR